MKRFVSLTNENVVVSGRLLTVESVRWASDAEIFPKLGLRSSATVYLSPKAQGVTAGATPQGPATTTPAGTAARRPLRAPRPGPDRDRDPMNAMQELPASSSGTTCARGGCCPWPVLLVAGADRRAARALEEARRSRRRPRPSRPPQPQPRARQGPEALAAGQARGRARGQRAPRSSAFDASNPFAPPEKVLEASARRGPGHDRHATPRHRHRRHRAAAGTGDRRRRHATAAPAAARPTPATDGGDPKTTEFTYVLDVTFWANGRKRTIEGLEKLDMLPSQAAPAADLHGRHRQRRQRGLPRRLDARRPRARASASRAAPTAPSSTWAPAPSRSSPTTRATPTGCASTRSARSRSATSPARPRTDSKSGKTARRGRRSAAPRAASPSRCSPISWPSPVDEWQLNRRRRAPIEGVWQCAVSSPSACSRCRPWPLLATAPVASAARRTRPSRRSRASRRCASASATSLTIRGTHFKSKASSNTVIFRANNGRTAFAKPRRASKHQARRARAGRGRAPADRQEQQAAAHAAQAARAGRQVQRVHRRGACRRS